MRTEGNIIQRLSESRLIKEQVSQSELNKMVDTLESLLLAHAAKWVPLLQGYEKKNKPIMQKLSASYKDTLNSRDDSTSSAKESLGRLDVSPGAWQWLTNKDTGAVVKGKFIPQLLNFFRFQTNLDSAGTPPKVWKKFATEQQQSTLKGVKKEMTDLVKKFKKDSSILNKKVNAMAKGVPSDKSFSSLDNIKRGLQNFEVSTFGPGKPETLRDEIKKLPA